MTAVTTLGRLLADLLPDVGSSDIAIAGLSIDSRQCRRGDLFFAYPGVVVDGRDYISEAVECGASAVVYEADDADIPNIETVPLIAVEGLREKVGVIAERYFDNPGRDLFIIGITGTNGKTSCAHLLAQAFERLDVYAAVIGTLGWGFVHNLHKASLTTPDPVSLHRTLQDIRSLGATHVCMEVSSHALAQGRVSGVSFDAALFTNLSHDHLDYHNNFADYAAAKELLFEFPALRFAVINRDDNFGRELASRVSTPTWTYGLSGGDVTAGKVEAGVSGLNLELKSTVGLINADTELVGRINVHNVLAVAAVLLADGSTAAMTAEAIDHLAPVPGRMELFQKTHNGAPSVVVDYAHTPDALERSLSSIREHCSGRVWCVFGCGGDRDRAKRPLMGAIAEALADEVVVTDDNPRHETPGDITSEIIAGMAVSPAVINDRVQAIEWAISHARKQDWVLIAGKGHEDTQQVGDEFLAMDDRTIVGRCLGVAA
jgi:UDP-N-acetylmuramoyl-L-alanyl-D-glutamate--2,6-diaminopimelate ligase